MGVDRAASAETDPQASCIRITDSNDGSSYYVHAAFRDDADGEECVDLIVTDLKRAWTATGVRKPATGLYLDRWLAVAREALTGVQDNALDTKKASEPGASPYKWTVAAVGGKLKLGWTFDMVNRAKGKFMTYKGHVEADEAADAGTIVEALVSQLVANAHSYKVSCLSLQQTVAGFQEETKLAQDALDEELTKKEKREQDLYIKFAAVLNESKKKCRELLQRAELAEQRLDQGEATPTDRSESEAESTEMGDGGDIANLDGVTSSPAAAGDADLMDADTQPIAAAAEPEPIKVAAAEESEPELEPEKPMRRVAAKKKRPAAPRKKATMDSLMGEDADFSSQ